MAVLSIHALVSSAIAIFVLFSILEWLDRFRVWAPEPTRQSQRLDRFDEEMRSDLYFDAALLVMFASLHSAFASTWWKRYDECSNLRITEAGWMDLFFHDLFVSLGLVFLTSILETLGILGNGAPPTS